jgi:hypothetical protein
MRTNVKTLLPLILLFIILNSLIISFKSFLEDYGFDRDFLIIANLLLFLLSISAFLLQRKALQSPNPNAFVRGVYSAILIKLFVCMIAFFAYAFVNKSVNKPALFTSMGFYILYTALEVVTLMKVARERKNV